jgi:hypothetical protein
MREDPSAPVQHVWPTRWSNACVRRGDAFGHRARVRARASLGQLKARVQRAPHAKDANELSTDQ